ncbi:MAG: hypothetical protein R3221_11190 [Spongiibacter sp.]|nr:hypothetical protein [Spongiibacter sp.]
MTDTSTTRVPYPRRRSTLAAALALLTSNSSVVMAQAAANSSYALEEIVVTAQKRSENVNDVPIAINAFSGGGLEKAGVKSMADLAMKTPGLV